MEERVETLEKEMINIRTILRDMKINEEENHKKFIAMIAMLMKNNHGKRTEDGRGSPIANGQQNIATEKETEASDFFGMVLGW